ncbi:MAG TPA: HNH endonuclease [Porticoccaceae bacterium]|nr:HNH endonuclease [Porticoccaceae bacterium]
MKLTQDRLKESLTYDPLSGVFTWKTRPASHFKAKKYQNTWNTRYSGKQAGAASVNGYLRTSIDGKHYFLHRLAFLYMIGRFPLGHTDHINGDRTDNRWVNLRDISQQENNKNIKLSSVNTSGVTGVYWASGKGKWAAQINDGGKAISLGRFDKFDDACAARKTAEIKYNYHPNHGRSA